MAYEQLLKKVLELCGCRVGDKMCLVHALVNDLRQEFLALTGPCYCDPPGSGEEYCHETCVERDRLYRDFAKGYSSTMSLKEEK